MRIVIPLIGKWEVWIWPSSVYLIHQCHPENPRTADNFICSSCKEHLPENIKLLVLLTYIADAWTMLEHHKTPS